MIRALFSAGSGMTAQQMNVDNIANNIANANTAGFKMRRTQFQDLLYQSVVQPGNAAGSQTTVAAGLQLGLGTRPAANEIIFTQGDFHANQQSPRCRDPRRRLLPDPSGERPNCIYARGRIPARPQRERRHAGRQSAGAADHHSTGGAIHHASRAMGRSVLHFRARTRRKLPGKFNWLCSPTQAA